jgi:tRNA(Ile)-lysidine synthase
MPSTKLPPFAFKIARSFGERLRGQKLLLACSGGLDSVVLLDVLSKLAPRFSLALSIAHIHHGPAATPDDEALSFRERARDFVLELAATYQMEFFTRESPDVLKSEEALRRFRLETLNDFVRQGRFDRVALAHHADDLFETRLMRLIRGTGPRGLIAMSEMNERAVRPFLRSSRSEISAYAEQNELRWIEDPSNAQTNYFRNWLRREWLPALEEKRRGSVASFARSLDLLSEDVSRAATATAVTAPRFARREFHALGANDKRALLSAVAFSQGARDFGQAKIIEVLKRLDRLEVSRQRQATFVVGGVKWLVTPLEIEASVHRGPLDGRER